MKDVFVRIGSSVAAAVIVYITLTIFTAALGTGLKVAIAATVGLCAFGVAVWAASGKAKEESPSVAVATNLKGGSVRIEDVSAEVDSRQKARVASDIEAPGPVEIKKASIKSGAK